MVLATIAITMEKDGDFANFDNEQTYNESQKRALNEATRNFVVNFGANEAKIAFDLQADGIRDILYHVAPAERPVRWM